MALMVVNCERTGDIAMVKLRGDSFAELDTRQAKDLASNKVAEVLPNSLLEREFPPVPVDRNGKQIPLGVKAQPGSSFERSFRFRQRL